MRDIATDWTVPAEFAQGESSVRYYCRQMPAVFVRASNARIWDEEGTEYIDFLSACGSLNYGHNHAAMKDAVLTYLSADGILNGLDLHTGAKRDFIRSFREIILAPRGLPHRLQFTGPTGTNAVEAALKLARKVTGRRLVAAFTRSFHGMTTGALSVSSRREARRSAGVQLEEVVRLPFEGYHGAGTAELDRFEAMVNDPSGGIDQPAAFIVEAIQGEGGLNAASAAWLRHLAATAKRMSSLLIVDDVQAGCGRTGNFFSFENTGVTPDMICLAKSISGIGLPMALLLIKPEFDQWAPGEHNGTFRGNNLAFISATVAARLWQTPQFLKAMASSSARISGWLAATVQEIGRDAATPKGRGLMSGLAFTQPAMAKAIAAEAFKHRLLVETGGPHGDVLKLFPPLTIESGVLEEGLDRLRSAIVNVAARGCERSAA
jgi:diaminobutyrate-2-oxoglutarate transaminase